MVVTSISNLNNFITNNYASSYSIIYTDNDYITNKIDAIPFENIDVTITDYPPKLPALLDIPTLNLFSRSVPITSIFLNRLQNNNKDINNKDISSFIDISRQLYDKFMDVYLSISKYAAYISKTNTDTSLYSDLNTILGNFTTLKNSLVTLNGYNNSYSNSGVANGFPNCGSVAGFNSWRDSSYKSFYSQYTNIHTSIGTCITNCNMLITTFNSKPPLRELNSTFSSISTVVVQTIDKSPLMFSKPPDVNYIIQYTNIVIQKYIATINYYITRDMLNAFNDDTYNTQLDYDTEMLRYLNDLFYANLNASGRNTYVKDYANRKPGDPVQIMTPYMDYGANNRINNSAWTAQTAGTNFDFKWVDLIFPGWYSYDKNSGKLTVLSVNNKGSERTINNGQGYTTTTGRPRFANY
jgi:hypothetical protein